MMPKIPALWVDGCHHCILVLHSVILDDGVCHSDVMGHYGASLASG